MKILFDNGTPKPIGRTLNGHEIMYARQIGWHELENGDLIAKAEEAPAMQDSNTRPPIRAAASA